ncbi:PTS beta-glucoside transporter subunit EIIBCA [Enterococcus silesiacus]|uniref:PTS system sucrose-specific EIIBCA component n=1 Tax=Enterococcus silesiacus TaxID=332949 RepID=A0A0S3KF15_9ENTE|nr:beta-glucoside-specific PTS transporter subunit IIABC [Enterococcus silesiacus]ALS02861.1 PTS beta-glucoside transporter subunit EIIBCA [Enterococcus silesiacus]OJG91807.1 PTS system, beta-glucoside-specific IIABC component [Enterococcus silesiacus]
MQDLAGKIILLVGGEENISSLTHCVTRLRFNLKNESKAQTKDLETLDGVMGIQRQGGQYQVIIGGKVGKVYAEIIKIVPRLDDHTSQEAPKGEKDSLLNRLINTLSAILVPSLAPIIGGGMLKGFLFMLTSLGWVNPESGTMFVLNMTGDAMFYFFPFLLAVSSARRFKTNEYMALSLAGVLMYPTLINAAIAGELTNVQFLGFLPVPIVNYSSSILPIILAVWLLSHVYRFFENVIPSMVTVIFTPLLTLILMVPVMLVVLAPIGFYVGEYIAQGIEALIKFSPLVSGFVIGASRPLLVLMGMHHAIRPITQQQIATYGYSTMGPMNFMSTMAQATAALAVYFLISNKKMKQVALSSTVSGYLGITEPALYGVLVKYKAAFVGASLGGGIGGAVGAVLGAKSMAPVMPSILSIPVFLNDAAIGFIIALIVTVIATFAITFLLAKSVMKMEDSPEKRRSSLNIPTVEKEQDVVVINAPVSGTVYPIGDVADQTFSKELVGKGIAIMPETDRIVSPVEGVVTIAFKTKHAIGLTSKEGIEVLIHVGLDTVALEGQYFELLCKQGQAVHVGTPLLQFDREKISEAGYDISVIVVVTNSDDYLSVLAMDDQKQVQEEETLITIVPGLTHDRNEVNLVME